MFRRLSFFIIILCITTAIATKVFAQDSIPTQTLKMKALTIDDGLSQGFVYGAIQDKDGFVWLATPDGLNRYDGHGFKVYRNNPQDPYSLPENFVTQIAEDDNRNLWVGTNSQGLFIFDRAGERFYPVALDLITDKNISATIKTLKFQLGRLYLGTEDNLIIANTVSVEPGKYKASELRSEYKIVHVLNVDDKQQGSLVMPDNTIIAYHEGSVTFYTPDAKLLHWRGKTFAANDFGIDSISAFTRFYKFPHENKLCIIDEIHLYVYDLTSKKIILKKPGNNFQYPISEFPLAMMAN